MRAKKGIFFIFIIILFFTLISFMILGKSIFMLKNVKITKDFDIDKEKLLNYLEVYPIRSIFKYNIRAMEEKLSRHYYLKEYKINKIYPDTLAIKIIIRDPLAKIVGKDGYLYNVDKNGIVFQNLNTGKETNPLIIFDKNENVRNGVRIGGKYEEFFDSLNFIKNIRYDLFVMISQIEVLNRNNYGMDYIISFKTLSNSIYLKNELDVDSIRKGLSCIKYLYEKNDYGEILLYTDNAFKIVL